MKTAIQLSKYAAAIILGASFTAKAAINPEDLRPINSKSLSEKLFTAIDENITWANGDQDEERGAIWISEDSHAMNMSIVGKIQKDPKSGVVTVNTFSEFECGSEYDESAFYGSCEVKLQKNTQWEVLEAKNCTCD
jgi:hypothetical protein